MKIVAIDTTIDEDLIGGAHTFLVQLLTGVTSKGNEVHLITKGMPNSKVLRQIKESGAALHTDLWDQSMFVEETAPVLAKWLNDLHPDLFLISASGDIGWVVLPLLNPETATLTIGHTDSGTFYLPARHYRNFVTRAVGVSPEVCQAYQSSCGIDSERTEWIPYGVVSSPSAPEEKSSGSLNLVYVGRLEEEQKRISDLIRVIKLLSEKEVDFRLKLIGDGEKIPSVKTELSGEIAAGRAEVLGWLESEKVIEAIRDSDVFVLTSAYEGFCIALAESLANGCCAVVTDIKSGNRKLVKDGENGFILPIGDVKAIAEKLELLANDRDKLLEMRKKAWEAGKEYSIDRMIDAYIKCFRKAIEYNRAHKRTPDYNFPLMETCRSKYPLWLRRMKVKLMPYISPPSQSL